MAKSKRSPGKKSPAKAKSSPKADSGTKGDAVRMLPPTTAVKSYINEIIRAKNQTSTVGQDVSSATKRAQNAGINIPAARLAVRFVSKAKVDPAAARVLWEDVQYYLLEACEFDKIAPAGMFSAEVTRSTKNGKSDSTKRKGEQTDIEDAASEMQAEAPVEAASDDPADEVALH